MRDTPYATERQRVEDEMGQRIERLFIKSYGREEIRFSWWKNGRMQPRPLDLPEVELLNLMRDAIQQGMFSQSFIDGLREALPGNLDA